MKTEKGGFPALSRLVVKPGHIVIGQMAELTEVIDHDGDGTADEYKNLSTGFGLTGKLFAHEHYGIRPDLLCIGKGVTSTLPLAAVLGPAEVLDVLPPAAITTTHAAHPLSCAAALAEKPSG